MAGNSTAIAITPANAIQQDTSDTGYAFLTAALDTEECRRTIRDVEPYVVPSIRNAMNGNDSGDILAPWLAHQDGPLLGVMQVMYQSIQAAAQTWGPTSFELPMVAALRYVPGQSQDWHRDGNLDLHRRWVSAVLYLSAPDEYTGGEIELSSGEVMRPERSTVLLLRGNVTHRVRKVTGGVRWAIAAFAAGDRT